MKQDRSVAFFAGFVPTGFILAFILLGLKLLTFDLGGGETLQEIELQRNVVLTTTLLMVLTAGWIARDVLKNQKQNKARGIRVMALICLLVVAGNYVYNLTIPTSFDKTKWGQSEYKPFHMAATLVKRDTLIGLTVQKATELLGSDGRNSVDAYTGTGSFQYHVHDGWTLIVIFKNGKVVETLLHQPYLGV